MAAQFFQGSDDALRYLIDPTPEGMQPMWDVERELVIAFNGEIYNHRELRASLERRRARAYSQ